jgi:hypothetical protein
MCWLVLLLALSAGSAWAENNQIASDDAYYRVEQAYSQRLNGLPQYEAWPKAVWDLTLLEAQSFPASRRGAYHLALFSSANRCLQGHLPFRACVSETKQELMATIVSDSGCTHPAGPDVIPSHLDAPH